MNRELLHAVTTIEAGQHTYIDADIDEVREFISGMDHLRCAPVGHGKVKISKLKSERKSLIALVRQELQKFDGTPIPFSGVDAQQLRNAVSRYNKDHNAEFSVRTVENDSYQVHSHQLEDRAVITQEDLDQIEEEFNQRYAKLSEKISTGQQPSKPTFEQFHDHVIGAVRQEMGLAKVDPENTGWLMNNDEDPKLVEHRGIPPFRGIQMVDVTADTAVCTRCGDEYYKQGTSSLCGDCIEDDDLV